MALLAIVAGLIACVLVLSPSHRAPEGNQRPPDYTAGQRALEEGDSHSFYDEWLVGHRDSGRTILIDNAIAPDLATFRRHGRQLERLGWLFDAGAEAGRRTWTWCEAEARSSSCRADGSSRRVTLYETSGREDLVTGYLFEAVERPPGAPWRLEVHRARFVEGATEPDVEVVLSSNDRGDWSPVLALGTRYIAGDEELHCQIDLTASAATPAERDELSRRVYADLLDSPASMLAAGRSALHELRALIMGAGVSSAEQLPAGRSCSLGDSTPTELERARRAALDDIDRRLASLDELHPVAHHLLTRFSP